MNRFSCQPPTDGALRAAPCPRRAIIALILACASGLGGAASAKNVTLTVYHTNDVHGWIMARPIAAGGERADRLGGGIAAFASLVRRDKGAKLVLDAGDWFQGTPEGNMTRGQAVVDAYNAVGYDAAVIGNHDFDFGEPRLKELVAGMKFPALGANVYREKDGRRVDYLKPWIIKEVAGIKVGIFGLLTTNMRNLTFAENFAGLSFRREADEAKEAVKALRADGATVVIAVTHVGFEGQGIGKFEGDQTIAAEVPGIDLIVGGHTHTFVREPRRDPKNGTLIVQDGTTLATAGIVTLEIDEKTKRVVASRGRLADLWLDEVGEAKDVAAIVQKSVAEVSRLVDVAVATAAARLARDRDAESSIGDWMADCARDWAATDIAVQNAGGIRADLKEGPVTLRGIFNIMPFDNRMVKLRMRGRKVAGVLDHGVDKTKGIIQVSGVKFSYDRDKPDGQRLGPVQVGDKPLDPDAAYTVATIDFLAKGGDGYASFAEADSAESTKTLMRDVLGECARRQSLIQLPPGGRMTPDRSKVETKTPESLQYAGRSVEFPMVQKAVYLRAAEILLPRLAAQTQDWAVILDVDDTVLSNLEYSLRVARSGTNDPDDAIWDAWVQEKKSTAVPGAKDFLDKLHAFMKEHPKPRGHVVFIPNRRQSQEKDTRDNLASAGLWAPEDVLLTMKDKADDKEKRRRCVALGNTGTDERCGGWAPVKIAALLGDSFRDFFELYGDEVYKSGRTRLESCVDAGDCFVVPNPMYGQWQSEGGSRPYER